MSAVHPRALLRDPLHFLALGGGSGLAPRLPGTAGTLVAALLCRQLLRDPPLLRRTRAPRRCIVRR